VNERLKDIKEVLMNRSLNDDSGFFDELIETLDEAMDIVHDYESVVASNRRMTELYETEHPAIGRGMGYYQCPVCSKRVGLNNGHCHWCGARIGWTADIRKRGKKGCQRK